MHTNRKSMRFGAQLSCKMSRGAHFDCAVSAGKIQDFHSKKDAARNLPDSVTASLHTLLTFLCSLSR